MRFLLIQPGNEGSNFRHSLGMVEPLGLEMIGAALARKHEVELLDMRLSNMKELVRRIEDFKPQGCGISSTFTVDYNQAVKISEVIKGINPDIFVFVGGHHPSLQPEDFHLPSIDAIVVGEGEITASEMADCLEAKGDLRKVAGLVINYPGGQLQTPQRELLGNLDQLLPPARHLIDENWRHYRLTSRQPVSSVETARGCPYRCKFCSVWVFYKGRVRFKSPERVIREIEGTKSENIFFTDDNFFSNVARAKRIAELLKERGIKRKYIVQVRSDVIASHPELVEMWTDVGLEVAFLGFEKVSQEELDSIEKRNTVENNERALEILRSVGIEPMASFIVDPSYDKKDFAALRRYIKKLKLRFPSFTVLTPLPGTRLFEEFRDKLLCRNYNLFDLIHPVLPTRLPLRDFCKEFARLYRMAYPPAYLFLMRIYVLLKSLKGQLIYSDWKQVFRDWIKLSDPEAYLSDVKQVCPNLK